MSDFSLEQKWAMIAEYSAIVNPVTQQVIYEGGNTYKNPHTGATKRQREGERILDHDVDREKVELSDFIVNEHFNDI
jgi:hypothetical protein